MSAVGRATSCPRIYLGTFTIETLDTETPGRQEDEPMPESIYFCVTLLVALRCDVTVDTVYCCFLSK